MLAGGLGCQKGRPAVLVTAAKRPVKTGKVDYGKDWYQQTKQNARRFKTVKEELEYSRKSNWEANNGRERKDLYTGVPFLFAAVKSTFGMHSRGPSLAQKAPSSPRVFIQCKTVGHFL